MRARASVLFFQIVFACMTTDGSRCVGFLFACHKTTKRYLINAPISFTLSLGRQMASGFRFCFHGTDTETSTIHVTDDGKCKCATQGTTRWVGVHDVWHDGILFIGNTDTETNESMYLELQVHITRSSNCATKKQHYNNELLNHETN